MNDTAANGADQADGAVDGNAGFVAEIRAKQRDEAQISVDSQELQRHVQTSLDQGSRDLIGSRAIFIGLVYLVLAGSNYFTMALEVRVTTVLLAAVVSVIFLGFAAFHFKARYDPRHTNLFSFVELAFLQLDGMAFLVVTDDIMNGYGVVIMIIAAGVFMTTMAWVITSILVLAASWLLVLVLFDFGFDPVEQGLIVLTSMGFSLFVYIMRRRSATGSGLTFLREQAYRTRLETALDEIETLSGLLRICASCKDIKDEQGNWTQLEDYVSQHAEVEFTHSYCPACLEKLHPEYFKKMPPE